MSGAFTFIDLFAGIGGFRFALESVGGKCIGFSEIAADAIRAYCENYREDERWNFGDITKISNLPQHDFMTAGVPCQSWSIAGKNLGFDDDRGQLWNDTLFLLNKSRPKAFIFENVKGLADPRNKSALEYIFSRIKEAGFHARQYVINARDYGVPQTRIRIYIVGFQDRLYFDRFALPAPYFTGVQLGDVLDGVESRSRLCLTRQPRWSLSCNEQGFNDYFLFNDLRNGETTVHSWDIKDTTERQKEICLLLLRNRRKGCYGPLDGNPLSLHHFQCLDSTIVQSDLDGLVGLNILKKVDYLYKVIADNGFFSMEETAVLSAAENRLLNFDVVKNNREFRKKKIDVAKTLKQLEEKGAILCIEERYDFKNSKISSGLDGVNRIFLPTSRIYPTLVASDTNDFISTVHIEAETICEFKKKFIREIYIPKKFRKITKREACRIQGFPDDFILPKTRSRWMHLLGNSVAVPVVKMLAEAVVNTGVFGGKYVSKKTVSTERLCHNLELFPEYVDSHHWVRTV